MHGNSRVNGIISSHKLTLVGEWFTVNQRYEFFHIDATSVNFKPVPRIFREFRISETGLTLLSIYGEFRRSSVTSHNHFFRQGQFLPYISIARKKGFKWTLESSLLRVHKISGDYFRFRFGAVEPRVAIFGILGKFL